MVTERRVNDEVDTTEVVYIGDHRVLACKTDVSEVKIEFYFEN